MRRKPTPPFAGCPGNLLFRGSRGLQTGRPVDHRPYSARHVGLLVESFWNNKDSVLYKGRELRLATNRHAFMAEIGISRLPSTPRRHTVEVSASLGPQQAGRIPINALSSVRPVDVHVLSVHPVVCAFFQLTPIPLVLFVRLVIGVCTCFINAPYKCLIYITYDTLSELLRVVYIYVYVSNMESTKARYPVINI